LIGKTYRTWLQERAEATLTSLPEGFLQENAKHFAQLRSGYNLLERSSLRYRLITREMELLTYMLRDLMAIRFRKIGMRPQGRVEELQQYADDWSVMQRLFEAIDAQERTLQHVVHGELEAIGEPGGKRLMTVRILKETPAFVGIDGEERGPYLAEDVVSLPASNARMLTRQGYAVFIAEGPGPR
jgi:DNA replication initiation complex subunit (GINS family)